MHATTLIILAIRASVMLNVFGLGLDARPQDALYLFRRPGLLMRALLAMYILMPLFAVALAGTFALHLAVEIALVGLAVSPIPPLLPKQELKAGGESAYIFGLLVAMSLLSIVFIPMVMELLGRTFRLSLHMSPVAVLELVLLTVLAPLVAGMAVRRVKPEVAERIARPTVKVAMALLVLSVLPVLFIATRPMLSLIGNGTLAAILAFFLVGLVAGHLLGGPNPHHRTVLALCTAFRHPGIAIAIAQANFPQQKLVLPAILLYLIVGAVMSSLYLAWDRRHVGIPGTVQRA
jgi:BASS family bile acid:Na+ symporter